MELRFQILKDRGYKLTLVRREMISALSRKPTVFTAQWLHRAVSNRIPNVGLQSIYRNLGHFTKIGLTEQLSVRGREAYYALCGEKANHHHHAVCRKCHQSIEIEGCGLQAESGHFKQAVRKIRRRTGFVVEKHELEFHGVCHDCR